MDAVQFVSKWMHLLSIIGVLGGIMFAWIVMRSTDGGDGSAVGLANETRVQWKRWGIAQAVFWVVALATGFANYAFVSTSVAGRYHMFIGMKMTLGILMFLIALAVAHPLPGISKYVRKKSGWLLALIVLGVVIVGLSAHLNMKRVKRDENYVKVLRQVSPAVPEPGAPAP